MHPSRISVSSSSDTPSSPLGTTATTTATDISSALRLIAEEWRRFERERIEWNLLKQRLEGKLSSSLHELEESRKTADSLRLRVSQLERLCREKNIAVPVDSTETSSSSMKSHIPSTSSDSLPVSRRNRTLHSRDMLRSFMDIFQRDSQDLEQLRSSISASVPTTPLSVDGGDSDRNQSSKLQSGIDVPKLSPVPGTSLLESHITPPTDKLKKKDVNLSGLSSRFCPSHQDVVEGRFSEEMIKKNLGRGYNGGLPFSLSEDSIARLTRSEYARIISSEFKTDASSSSSSFTSTKIDRQERAKQRAVHASRRPSAVELWRNRSSAKIESSTSTSSASSQPSSSADSSVVSNSETSKDGGNGSTSVPVSLNIPVDGAWSPGSVLRAIKEPVSFVGFINDPPLLVCVLAHEMSVFHLAPLVSSTKNLDIAPDSTFRWGEESSTCVLIGGPNSNAVCVGFSNGTLSVFSLGENKSLLCSSSVCISNSSISGLFSRLNLREMICDVGEHLKFVSKGDDHSLSVSDEKSFSFPGPHSCGVYSEHADVYVFADENNLLHCLSLTSLEIIWSVDLCRGLPLKIFGFQSLPEILVSFADNSVSFVSLENGECRTNWIAHASPTTSCSFAANNAEFVTSDRDNCSLRVWKYPNADINLKDFVVRFRSRDGRGILGVAFHPTENLFAACGANGQVKLFLKS